MTRLEDHPTVQSVQERLAQGSEPSPNTRLNVTWLKQLCLEHGADDVGLVSIDRSELDDQRDDILACYPPTKTLISFVCRTNREPIRNPARSITNHEFHNVYDKVNDVARNVVAGLETRGIGAVNPSAGFPMEMQRFPGKIWVVSHKLVAQAAGLGKIGIHRNVIHPWYGNFILLGTILIDIDATQFDSVVCGGVCLSVSPLACFVTLSMANDSGRFSALGLDLSFPNGMARTVPRLAFSFPFVCDGECVEGLAAYSKVSLTTQRVPVFSDDAATSIQPLN